MSPINFQPVNGLPSPFKIPLIASHPAYGSVTGHVTSPIDSAVIQTNLALIVDNTPWTITPLQVEYLDFPVGFESLGKPIANYANLTQSYGNANVQAGDGSYARFEARAVAGGDDYASQPLCECARFSGGAALPLELALRDDQNGERAGL